MNARPRAAYLLSGLLALAGASYQSTEPEPAARPASGITVSYAPTQCADPWGFVRGNQLLADSASAYLRRKGIVLTGAQASVVNTGMVCAACTCPTGVELVGTVPVAQLTDVQALGFKKK